MAQYATPIAPNKILVTGADGQLERALRRRLREYAHLEYTTREAVDLISADLRTARRWRDYVAAYTAVDAAKTPDGRAAAWSVDATAVARLAAVAAEHGITLIHITTDWVFDGASDHPRREDDPLAPLGVYGQTRGTGALAAATAPRH